MKEVVTLREIALKHKMNDFKNVSTFYYIRYISKL